MTKKRKELPKFEVGDRVYWESQAGGSWKRKEGIVVAVVPPGMSAFRAAKAQRDPRFNETPRRDLLETHSRCFDGAWSKAHTQYLVSVDNPLKTGGYGKPRLYCPVVSKLQRA